MLRALAKTIFLAPASSRRVRRPVLLLQPQHRPAADRAAPAEKPGTRANSHVASKPTAASPKSWSPARKCRRADEDHPPLRRIHRESGVELPARQFTIDGNEAHFDAEIIKFKDEYVESDDPLRGQSIMLFVRVYGADQAPSAGFPIDTARPDSRNLPRLRSAGLQFRAGFVGQFLEAI